MKTKKAISRRIWEALPAAHARRRTSRPRSCPAPTPAKSAIASPKAPVVDSARKDEKKLNFFRRAAVALDAFEEGFVANVLERTHGLSRTVGPALQIAANFAPWRSTRSRRASSPGMSRRRGQSTPWLAASPEIYGCMHDLTSCVVDWSLVSKVSFGAVVLASFSLCCCQLPSPAVVELDPLGWHPIWRFINP